MAGPTSPPRAVVFTDIEGSTALWERDEAAMRQAHRAHNRILISAFAEHGGAVVKDKGDGYMAVFVDPVAAVAAAAAVERGLDEADWPEPIGPLRVRIAISTGVIEDRDGNLFGTEVNRVARLEAMAHGGQVLLSEVTAALVANHLPAGLTVTDLGLHRLRGMSRDEHVHQLVVPGLPDTFPPLHSARARGRRLPEVATSFLGRDSEMEEIVALLGAGSRLVTLLGAGGIGKTRLAVETARRLEPETSGGVFFADLEPVASSEEVAPAFAEAVGVHPEGTADVMELVADGITAPTLVVVDSFDHLIAAGPSMGRVLEACPDLSLIVTSRTPLGLRGERVYPVSALAVSTNGAPSPAVELFYDRAASHGARLGESDRPAVESICRRLDGLPLAIELVAARTRLLGVAELDRMLEGSLDALAAAGPDVPERHRTIRATIEWSLRALTDDQRSLFARLSALPAGATLEVVEAVCAAGLHAPALDDVAALVDHSLVYSVTDQPGGTRFRQLAPLREYGLELLEAAGETRATLDRLVDHYVATLPALYRRWDADATVDSQLGVDHANLSAAMEWSITAGRVAEMARVLVGVWPYWFNGDRLSTLAEWTGKVDGTVDAAQIDWLAGLVAFQRGDFPVMMERCSRALEAFHAAGDEWGGALATLFLSTGIEDPNRARAMLADARTGLDRAGDPLGPYLAHIFESVVDAIQGDHESSLRRRQEALIEARRLGHPTLIAWAQWNLALAHIGLGQHREAAGSVRETLEIMVEAGYQEGIASAAHCIGVLEVAAGRTERGVRLLAAADSTLERVGVVAWIEMVVHITEAVEEARRRIGDAEADRLYEEGRRLGLADAVELSSDALTDLLAAPEA